MVARRSRPLWLVSLALILAAAVGCTRGSAPASPGNGPTWEGPLFEGSHPEFLALDPGDLINGVPKAQADLRNKDVSKADLLKEPARAFEVTFDVFTVWPAKEKWPEGFDPARILAWGKDPGLGVSAVHDQGYTGKGVNVAYVDQPLLLSHKGLKGIDLVYTKVRLTPGQGDDTSMHGPSVASDLAAPGIGVAPDVKLFYYAHPPWLTDQTTHADALHAVIEQNRKLPAGQKIRAVGFSDGPDPSEKNIEAYKQAIKDAEAEGILVVDVLHPFSLVPIKAEPYKDKNDPANWSVAAWMRDAPRSGLGVPVGGRTLASGYPKRDDSYTYWSEGGLSWAVPYVVGTLALGWQADPALSIENAVKYLVDSAFQVSGRKVINPDGFVRMVLKYKR